MKTLALYGDSLDLSKDYPQDQWTIADLREQGSSLWYNYGLFLDTHEAYDSVVFVVPPNGRWYYREAPGLHIPSLAFLEQLIKDLDSERRLTRELKIRYTAIIKWFQVLQIYCPDYEPESNRLLVENITRIRPDVRIIPCQKS